MVNPDVASPPAEQADGPKEAGAAAVTTTGHKPRKHGKRSARKARRGSDDKDTTAVRSTTARTRRHKHKAAKGAAGLDENEDRPGQAPPLLSPEDENERARQQEGSVSPPSGLMSPKVPAFEGAADAGKQDNQGANRMLQAGPQPSMALSPGAETERQAEPGNDADNGTKKAGRSENANADHDAGKSPLPAKAVEDADVPGAADAEDQLKELFSEDGLERRKGRRMQMKRASCVSFHSPEEENRGQCKNEDEERSPSPQRRPSRSRVRKSDGDMRALYSVVALKDLASTLKSETAERAQPASQQRIAVPKAVRHRALGLVGIAVFLVVALTVLLWINKRFNVVDKRVCSSPACAELTATFEGVLNYSVDPCVDLDAFVCSKGLRGSSAERGSRSFVAQQIKEYELDMVHIFTNDEATFTASRAVTDFLLQCTDSSEASAPADSIIEFFDLMSIPWPFLRSGRVDLHPLDAVLALSLKWGIDTWFRAYIHLADYTGAPALFIEAAAQASTWLDFVRTLEEVGGRQKYFQLLYKRYEAPLPEAQDVEQWLALERDVLSTLDAVRSPGTLERPVIAHLAKLAANVLNCTVENWLVPVNNAPGGSTVNENTLVSVQDVRLLRAVGQLLSEHSPADLTRHLSWWLLQILIVIGSPQDYVLIAGSKEVATKEVKLECYRLMAARFGLLLASESALKFFTSDSRRDVEVFLRGLLDFLGGVAAKTARLSDKAKVAIAKRIQDLDVTVWPLKVDASNGTLWQLYEHFCESCQLTGNVSGVLQSRSSSNESRRAMLLDNWVQANVAFWSLSAEKRELMQLQWHSDRLDEFQYESLANRLRVSHAALRRHFYSAPSYEVLAANLGGLGAAFLTYALQMFVAPATDIEPDVPLSTWPEISGVAEFTDSANCSADFLSNLRDILALALAWRILQTTGDVVSVADTRLAIKDDRQVEHLYSAHQLFFLSYCRGRCAGSRRIASQRGHDCNAAVRSISDFGRTFNCTPGSPMVPHNACHVSNLF